jgi:hypothetical protein
MTVSQPPSDLRSSDRFDETVPYPPQPDAQDAWDAQDGQDNSTALAAPPCQWLATASAFADGGVVTGDELAGLLRQHGDASPQLHVLQPEALVARWIASNVVVTVESPWGRMLPVFQFDLPRGAVHACMRPLLAELRGVFDDAELAQWFVTPNEWIQGRRPAHAMLDDLPGVRLAARTDRYVALGG